MSLRPLTTACALLAVTATAVGAQATGPGEVLSAGERLDIVRMLRPQPVGEAHTLCVSVKLLSAPETPGGFSGWYRADTPSETWVDLSDGRKRALCGPLFRVRLECNAEVGSDSDCRFEWDVT